MLNDPDPMPPVPPSATRFYGSFIGVLKWSVVAIALLLIVMAVFLA